MIISLHRIKFSSLFFFFLLGQTLLFTLFIYPDFEKLIVLFSLHFATLCFYDILIGLE